MPLTHFGDGWQASWEPRGELIDIKAHNASLFDIYHLVSRLMNNMMILKARPAPVEEMPQEVCTA